MAKKTNDLNKQIEKIRRCELLSAEEINVLCRKGIEIFSAESNIVPVDPPVTVCGDVHGQFYDLLELFSVAGEMPETNYLFLGDFVDRGYHSIETFLYLLALKIRYPEKITLIRGNHEARAITQAYGFYDECLNKFGTSKIWQFCTDLFDTMPIAALVGNTVLGIHGGLSPAIQTLDEIRSLERMQEVPHQGPMCDLMWSDPEDCSGFKESPRGAGYLFGGDVARHFVDQNGLEFVARAHQLVMEGYKWHFSNTLLTVWSAPNYCYRCGNLAAVLELDEHMNKNFVIFEAAPNSSRLGSNYKSNANEYFV